MNEALATPDSKVIPSRWVLCNKGDAETPDVRARLVGCEINTYKDDAFYASTPPLVAKRMLLSEFATKRTKGGRALQLSFVDVKKTQISWDPGKSHLRAIAARDGARTQCCGTPRQMHVRNQRRCRHLGVMLF